MRVAVVGHVEWVDFLEVSAPPERGEIVQARSAWALAAGGGADAAVQLARLAGTSLLVTALGDDALGHRAHAELSGRGVTVAAAFRSDPQRRAVCFLDDRGERTIALFGPKLVPHGHDALPWDEVAGADGVYFTGGDPEAVRAARRARVLVASARELPTLRQAAVELDVLVASAADDGERYRDGDLDPPPRAVVRTEGNRGGIVDPGSRRFEAAPPPGPVVDAYGAGDSFAACLTFALARGDALDVALAFAARCGASVLTARGPYAGQISS